MSLAIGGRAMEEGVEVAPPSRVDTGRTQIASACKLPRVWCAVAEGETATTATKGTKGYHPLRKVNTEKLGTASLYCPLVQSGGRRYLLRRPAICGGCV